MYVIFVTLTVNTANQNVYTVIRNPWCFSLILTLNDLWEAINLRRGPKTI